MSHRLSITLTTLLACLGWVGASTPGLWAQQEEGARPQGEAAQSPQAAPTEEDVGQSFTQDELDMQELGDLGIDDILEGDEAVLQGAGYTYDPGERRDPFRSLLRAPERVQVQGPRPPGKEGLLIDEVEVTGIFDTTDGPVAHVRSTHAEKSILLYEGDRLYDGDVLAIRLQRGIVAEVVFMQNVNDPTATKPFREVVKKLNP